MLIGLLFLIFVLACSAIGLRRAAVTTA